MAATVTVQSVEILPNGSVNVVFESGHGFVFGSLDELKAAVGQVDDRDNTQLVAMGWWLARQPDGSNTALVVGKTFTFDLSSPQLLRVQ